MPKIIVTDRGGTVSEIEVAVGSPIMHALRDNGFGVLALCGGVASCATCQVYVDTAWQARLPLMTEDEADLLSESDLRRPTSRLSCQIPMTDELNGLVLEVAPLE